MKIAQICFSGTGGHSSVVFSLVSADHKKNHEWFVGFIGNEDLSEVNECQAKKFKLHYKSFIFNKGQRIKAWYKLYKWLVLSKPLSVICHSSSMIFPCYAYSIIYPCKLISVEHQSNAHKKMTDWIFGFFSMLLSNQVILLTKNYLFELKKAYRPFFISSRFLLIPNGIDLSVFKCNKSNLSNITTSKEITLGMAARFAEPKRQMLLIHVVKMLNQIQSQYIFKLSFAGSGPNESHCKIFASELNIMSSVAFNGFLKEAELVNWFSDIDIYVHATDGETLSTSLLQAMSLRLPIIASNVSGVSNLLHQEDLYGILTPNKAKNFLDEVLSLVRSPEKYEKMIEQSYKKVSKEYSNDQMLKSYLRALSK